jgi:branched-chain amino acid transport system permease protein
MIGSVPVSQLLISGLSLGAVYALIAVAYSVVYRNTRTINFAQGDLGMLAAYIAYWAGTTHGIGLFPSYAVAVVAVAALSGLIEVIAFKPLYRYESGPVLVIVSSVGLVFVLETLMQLGWGSQAIDVASSATGSLNLGSAVVDAQRVVIVGCLVVLVAALQILLHGRRGIAMRAAAENPVNARLMGISPSAMATASYVIGGALSAVAGILVGPLVLLTPTGGQSIGLVGLVAAIVGGLGSIPGAVLGGLLMGLISLFGSWFLGGASVEPLIFGALIVLFVVRPKGLLGEEGTATRV